MTKRVKLNNQNFKVKNTKVYIAKATPSRPAPKPEIVEIVRRIWNKQDPKFTKHIKRICIQKSVRQYGNITIGYFNTEQRVLKIFDSDTAKINEYEVTVVHELAHAWWHWAYQYHREELKEFCNTVNLLPPFNIYMRNHPKWLTTVNSHKILDNHDEKWANQYPNEYHSAIAEFFDSDTDLNDYHEPKITQATLFKAKDAYDKLHKSVKIA